MISCNRTFDEVRAIKVLVVPIGDNSMFDKHFEIVSRIRCLPVFDLNRPSEWKSQESIFKNFNWNSSKSNILFDYLRYDRVANGPSDLENFQSPRRILIVIGVINFPEIDASSSRRLELDMDYYTRRHPHVILKRYFIFDYFSAVALAEPSAAPALPFADKAETDPYAMVVFPPDGECEGGSMLDVHTREIMGNIAVRLFEALDKQATACDELRGHLSVSSAPSLPSWLPLSTIFDEMEEGGASAGEVSRRMRKRLPGRLRKWMGDLCMQVFSPADAWEHYISAVSESRSCGDTMWLASALEGSVAAMLGLLHLGVEAEEELPMLVREVKSLLANGTVATASAAVVRVAEERCVEALSLYAKNIAWCVLEVECCLRLARVHEMLNFIHSEQQQKVMEFLMRAAAVPGLSVPQQIECTVEGAFICLRMRMYRKYAFLLFFAALLSAESENASVAHSLVRAACQHYGLKLTGQATGEDEVDIVQVDQPHKSWAGMRRLLFAHCAHFAKEYGDTPTTARCLAALLRLVGEMEDNHFSEHRLWVGDIPVPTDGDTGASPATAEEYKREQSDTGGDRPSSLRWRDVTQAIHVGKPLHHMHSAASQKLAMLYNLSSETLARGALPSLHDNSLGKSSRSVSTGGYGDHVNGSNSRGVKGGRSFSTFGQGSAISPLNLSHSSRGPTNGTVDMSHTEDGMTECSESSHDGSFTTHPNKGTGTDSGKPTRGHIGVPKIAPFVQKLVSQRRKHLHSSALNARPGNYGDTEARTPGGSSTTSDPTAVTSGQAPDVDMKSTSTTSPLPLPRPGKGHPASALAEFNGGDPSKRLGVPVELQKQSLNMLSQICEELPPATPLLLEGLPYLLRTRPLPDLEESTPRPLKVVSLGTEVEGQEVVITTSGASSALFYDPFEAKRARDRSRTSATVILWCQGAVARVEATFCNPLCVPLPLHDVHLLVDGVSHKSYPVKSVIVPPETEEFCITLSVCPLSVGRLTIMGVRYSIFNATHTSVVNPETGKGIHNLQSEMARPWRYPRRAACAMAIREPSIPRKSGSRLLTHAGDGEADRAGTKRIEISVVSETATLTLWTSWGSRVEHPPHVSMEPDSSQWNDPCQGLTANSPLSIFLFENEVRRESIRFTNTSSSLKVMDVRVSVQCTMSRSDASPVPTANTKISYTLIPFSVVSVAHQSMGPPLLHQSVFDHPTHAVDDQSQLIYPFLVRVVSMHNIADTERECLPLLPLESIVMELEFSSYHRRQYMPSTCFEFRLDVEYVTESPGIDDYLRVPSMGSLERKTVTEKKEDTLYCRRSFIVNEVGLVSSLKMENVVPLTRTSTEVTCGGSMESRLLPLRVQYPFLPELCDDSALACLSAIEDCLRSVGVSHSQHRQHQNRPDDPGTTTRPSSEDHGKRQGLRLRRFSFERALFLSGAGVSINCFHPHRTFTVQVTNNSSFTVLVSHVAASKDSGGSSIWKYIYPRAGDNSVANSMQLDPFRSANVVLSISEVDLREVLITQTKLHNCDCAEARRRLAATIEFHWTIVEPLSGRAVEVPHVARVGRLSLLAADAAWDDCLKLCSFDMSVDPPAPRNVSLYAPLQSRRFHRFGAAISLDEKVPGCRRHVEITFIVTCASGNGDHKSGSEACSVHCPPSVIITGSPHKVLAVPEEAAEGEAIRLRHEVGICFTKCGLYHVHSFARCRYRQVASGKSANDDNQGNWTTEEKITSWWTVEQPVAVTVK